MKIAIVTGASSGLGSEFVRQIRKQEKLDEIWVIARRKDRLMTLEKELRTSSDHYRGSDKAGDTA